MLTIGSSQDPFPLQFQKMARCALRCREGGFIAERYVDNGCKKKYCKDKHHTNQLCTCHETGNDAFPLGKISFYVANRLHSHPTHIYYCCQDSWKSAISEELWYLFWKWSFHESKAPQHNLTLFWDEEEEYIMNIKWTAIPERSVCAGRIDELTSRDGLCNNSSRGIERCVMYYQSTSWDDSHLWSWCSNTGRERCYVPLPATTRN